MNSKLIKEHELFRNFRTNAILVDCLTVAKKGIPYWSKLQAYLRQFDDKFLYSIVLNLSYMNVLAVFTDRRILITDLEATEKRFIEQGYTPDKESLADFIQDTYKIDISKFFKDAEDYSKIRREG